MDGTRRHWLGRAARRGAADGDADHGRLKGLRDDRSVTRDAEEREGATMTMVWTRRRGRETRHTWKLIRRQPVTFVRGQGCQRLWDAEATRGILDLLSGIGVAALGHSHPGFARAIAEQRRRSSTRRTCSTTAPGGAGGTTVELVRAGARVLLQQRDGSGGGVPKFARRYWHTRVSRARSRRARASRSTAARSARRR